MQMKKITIVFLTLIVCFSTTQFWVKADESPQFRNKYLEGIGEIIDGGTIIIDEKTNKLFVEFKDQKLAINNLKKRLPLFLIQLADYGDLQELNETNWKDYRLVMNEFLNEITNLGSYDEEILTMNSFFDIFENKFLNEEIKSIVELYNKHKLTVYKEELAMLLPYDSVLSLEYQQNRNASIMAAGSFSRDAAINYANQYAYYPNTANYHYFLTSDCANFVSQIFEAAGLIQSSGSNVDYGWWHHYSSGTHTHSKAWSYAHHLAVYFTVPYSTAYISSFTSNITAGDAIVLDYTNDGGWDHAGFVVEKASIITSGYYDCKIAQHITNYNAWISSGTNNWENYSGVGKYGRIRA